MGRRLLHPALLGVAACLLASAQQHVSIPTHDGGLIYADLYGKGTRAVVLAHGGRFNKESWAPQARELAGAGFRVLAFDFRGYGKSRGPGQADGPLYLDVLAAVRYLKTHGSTTVAAVGASLGGGAVGDAAIEAPGEIERVVFLGSSPDRPAEKLRCRSLFIVARDDPSSYGLPRVRAQYEAAPQPKELIVVDGSAHAQFLLQTDQGPRVMREMLRFLGAKP
jgi:pimeloyl-ACP methyl ester carboxylesterase